MQSTAILAVALFLAFPRVAFAQSSTSDEQQLLRSRTSRAWLQHDRAFIEGVLAPEWSVTQADGSLLTRATVLGTFFDAVAFEPQRH